MKQLQNNTQNINDTSRKFDFHSFFYSGSMLVRYACYCCLPNEVVAKGACRGHKKEQGKSILNESENYKEIRIFIFENVTSFYGHVPSNGLEKQFKVKCRDSEVKGC